MNRISRALRFLARTYWPLIPTIGTVFAVWLLFNHQEFGERSRKDGWVLFFVGTGYALITLFVLATTRHWSWRDLGQLLTYGADAMLYSIFGASLLGWRGAFSLEETNLLRSLFVVGMPILLVGVFWWIGDTRFGSRSEGWVQVRWRERRRRV